MVQTLDGLLYLEALLFERVPPVFGASQSIWANPTFNIAMFTVNDNHYQETHVPRMSQLPKSSFQFRQ